MKIGDKKKFTKEPHGLTSHGTVTVNSEVFNDAGGERVFVVSSSGAKFHVSTKHLRDLEKDEV